LRSSGSIHLKNLLIIKGRELLGCVIVII